jgi:hypothetical protein
MKRISLTTAALLGTAAAFAFDPVSGSRRRSRLRQRVGHSWRNLKHAAEVSQRDLSQRSRGVVAAARSRWRHEEVDDDKLVHRVAANVGRVVSHPRALGITAEDGKITLTGHIIASEIPRLMRKAALVRGVKAVENKLTAHLTPADVPELQGPPRRMMGRRWGIGRTHWTPTSRLFGLTLGTGLFVYGLLGNGARSADWSHGCRDWDSRRGRQ